MEHKHIDLQNYTITELLTGLEEGEWSDASKQAAREELKVRGFDSYTLADLKRIDQQAQRLKEKDLWGKTTIEINGHLAKVSYDANIGLLRGEFVGLTGGGADFYAQDMEGLKKEGEISLSMFLNDDPHKNHSDN